MRLSHIRIPNLQQNAPQSFLWAILGIVVLAAGCIRPAPPTPTPDVTETVTAAPYPNPVDYGEIGHNPYPAPVTAADNVQTSDAPTCAGNIEWPSRVWMLPNAPDDAYSETCIWSQMAGSSIVLFDQDGNATWVGGQFIGVFPPNCQRWKYRLDINGLWQVQIMVNDPGGMTLCSVSPYPLERWRYIFPVTTLEVMPWSLQK